MTVVGDIGWYQAVGNMVKNVDLHKVVNLQKAVLFYMMCACSCHIAAVQARGEQPWF
jgi:hypothetical protein